MKLFILILIITFTVYGQTQIAVLEQSPLKLIIKPENEIWVMVLDTGVADHDLLKPYVVRDGSLDYIDTNSHGTHVAGIVAMGPNNLNDPLCHNVKIFSCKDFDDQTKHINTKLTDKCIQKAIDMGIDYINVSSGGGGYRVSEYNLYKKFTESGGVVVAALGNENRAVTDQKPYFPASYMFGFVYKVNGKNFRTKPLQNFYAVQNETKLGRIYYNSNTHPLAHRARGTEVVSTILNNTVGPLTGTSMATPALLHIMLKQRCEDLKNNVHRNTN